MQTLHCTLLQLNKWFVILSEATVEKGLWNFVLLFIKALFALGVFVGYVNICEEIIQYLMKGVYERETSGYLYLSLYLQCPEEHTTLTKTLFMERTIL